MELNSSRIIGRVGRPGAGSVHSLDIVVKGWALSKDNAAVEVIVEINGRLCEVEFARGHRREVHALYPGYEPARIGAGFECRLPHDRFRVGFNEIVVTAISGTEKRHLATVPVWMLEHGDPVPRVPQGLGAVRSPDHPQPLLFVHIPKTGGTSINEYLSKLFSESSNLVHAENVIADRTFAELGPLYDKSFVSAHLTVATLKHKLDFDRFFSFTVLREPVAQLKSNLTWLHQLARPERSETLEASPRYIKEAVIRINSLPLAEFVDSLTSDERPLFDNIQTRYLISHQNETICRADLPDAMLTLGGLDLVGVTEQLDLFRTMLSFYTGHPLPVINLHVNASNRQSLEVLEQSFSTLGERVSLLTSLDQVLYREAASLMRTRLRAMHRLLAQSVAPSMGPPTDFSLRNAVNDYQNNGLREEFCN